METSRQIRPFKGIGLVCLAFVSVSIFHACDEALEQAFGQSVQQPLPGKLVQDSTERTNYRPSYDLLGRSPKLRSHSVVLRTFEQAAGDVWQSTVQIFSGKRQLALGTIVDGNGWVVTKASQLVHVELACRLSDGTRAPATLMHVNHELDLALLKIDAPKSALPAVRFEEGTNIRVGSWLASTTSSSKLPIGIGVVSVGPRRIAPTTPVLGVTLGTASEGALVSDVIEGGGAALAGIQKDDVIVSIDGLYLKDKNAVQQKIKTLRAGQRVTVGINRKDNSLSLDAQLMDLSANLFDPTEMEVNGHVSARASGFPKVFQHDTVLEPHLCGGPVVDTHGRVVGLNIARAGRVTTYALPLDVLVPAVRDMLTVVNSRPVANGARATR